MRLTNKQVQTVMFGAAILCTAGLTIAGGGGGEEFDGVYDLLEGWATGTLGKIISLAALIVGIGFGLVRQSVIAVVVGISMAMVLKYGPNVIEGIFGATAEGIDPLLILQMSNGLI